MRPDAARLTGQDEIVSGQLLRGRRVVVTGSSRGLGRAFAIALAGAGASVVVNGTKPAAVEQTVELIAAQGGTAIASIGSVADDAYCRDLVDGCVWEFGGIDVLVNNAGLTRDRSITKMTVEEFDEVVAVHLRGTWSCSSAAARHMRQTGGQIMSITSGSGLFGMFGQANYAAAKAGIVGLNRVMDLELGRFGVRCNVLAPVAATEMTGVFRAGDVAHALTFPPPEAVAQIVVHLASDDASHVRGQVLSFDGSRLSVWSHPCETATWERPEGSWSHGDFAAALTPFVMEETHPDRWGEGVLGR